MRPQAAASVTVSGPVITALRQSAVCAVLGSTLPEGLEIGLQEIQAPAPGDRRVLLVIMLTGWIREGMVRIVPMDLVLLAELLQIGIEGIDHGMVDPAILLGELAEHRP